MSKIRQNNKERLIDMKKFLAGILSSAIILSGANTCVLADNVSVVTQTSSVALSNQTENTASDVIKVIVDGQYIDFDVNPTIINNRTMVPVRAIFEALGAEVEWVEETKTVVSRMNDTVVKLTINQKAIAKDGLIRDIDVPALIVDDRTLVPVRAISEAYGCTVQWNQWNRCVVITSDTQAVTIAKANDENISMAYYNLVLAQVEEYAMNTFNCGPNELLSLWDKSLGNTSFGEYMATTALEQCVYTKANAQAAKKANITLTDKELDNIDSTIGDMIATYDDLAVIGTGEDAVEEFLTDNMLVNKYYDFLMEGSRSTDDEIEKYLDENYITAKHILFMTSDPYTGVSLSDEEIARKKALAEDTLKKIKAGEDFDKYMLELGEDPGVKSNPDGYLFTRGDMVKSFEDAAFALKIGAVSGIVESEYGYHIIKREKNAPYTPEIFKTVSNELIGNKTESVLTSNKSNAKTETNSNILSNIVPIGLE